MNLVELGAFLKSRRDRIPAALARALRLSRDERDHLFYLAGRPPRGDGTPWWRRLRGERSDRGADRTQPRVHGALDAVGTALGARGFGETPITGVPAAIGNAIFHATGRRIRDLPFTQDKLL